MGKLFNRGREKRKREEKVKVGKLFKDGEKKERGKEKLEVERLFKEGGEEKGEGKTRSGEDF